MKYKVSTYSNKGARESNEDSYIVTALKDKSILLVIADGLGGHNDGEVASKTAIDTIVESLNVGKTIEEGIQEANQKIYKLNKEGTNMMTTIVVVHIYKGSVEMAHVGDSRAYLFKDKQIVYQTRDHSVSQMAVMLGEITIDQIRHHADRNKLTRVLGCDEIVKVEQCQFDSNGYDAILLGTDGFWEYVLEEDMISSIYSNNDIDDALNELREVLERNKSKDNDNNTAILLKKYL